MNVIIYLFYSEISNNNANERNIFHEKPMLFYITQIIQCRVQGRIQDFKWGGALQFKTMSQYSSSRTWNKKLPTYLIKVYPKVIKSVQNLIENMSILESSKKQHSKSCSNFVYGFLFKTQAFKKIEKKWLSSSLIIIELSKEDAI